jgi:type VI secretion system protein
VPESSRAQADVCALLPASDRTRIGMLYGFMDGGARAVGTLQGPGPMRTEQSPAGHDIAPAPGWRPRWPVRLPRPHGTLMAAGFWPCLLLAVLIGAALSSCGPHFIGVEIRVLPGANDNSPVAVELLVVDDAKLVDKLLAMSAAEWFAQREQFKRDFGPLYRSELRECVPGQTVRFSMAQRSGAKAAILFADLFAQGAHRYRVELGKPVRAVVRQHGLVIEQ